MSPTSRRLGPLATLIESTRQSLRLLSRNRLMWLLLIGELTAGVVAWGIAGRERLRLDGLDLYCMLAWWFQAWVVLPWATMYLAVHAVHSEIEDRTFQYLFLRPVGRAPLLLGKWLAVSIVAGALVSLGGIVLYFAVAARPEIWSDGVQIAALYTFLELFVAGTLAYAAFGVCFAAAVRRPLVWAAVFVVVQMVIALLPVSAGVRALTVSDPLRRHFADRMEPDQRLEQILWPGERGLEEDMIGEPLVALSVLTASLLAIALYRYCRAEYDSRQRE